MNAKVHMFSLKPRHCKYFGGNRCRIKATWSRSFFVAVSSSVAGGDLNISYALLALDIAAPVKLALTPLYSPFTSRCIAPIAAKKVASIDALRSRVAFSSVCS